MYLALLLAYSHIVLRKGIKWLDFFPNNQNLSFKEHDERYKSVCIIEVLKRYFIPLRSFFFYKDMYDKMTKYKQDNFTG